MTPKISIVIPVHNTEKYLEQCLESVVKQTLKDIEIICVDDASTDNSLSVLKQYADKDSRIKVFHNETSKSALGARKKGVLAASGEYIMFLDADDYYSLDACELAFNKIKEKNVDILHFSLGVINCSNASQSRIDGLLNYVKPYEGVLEGNNVFKACFEEEKYTHTPVNKIYKADLCKKSYEQTEDVHLIFAEDLYAYFIIANNANSYCGWNSKPLYFYCYGRGITSSDKEYTIDRFNDLCKHSEVIKLLNKYSDLNCINAKIVVTKLKNVWLSQNIRVWIKHIDKKDKKITLNILYKYWDKKDVNKAIIVEKIKQYRKKLNLMKNI